MPVHIDTLDRVVRRLANQVPTRYWLDARGDGSFSHIAVDIWEYADRFPDRLDKELTALGFVHVPTPWCADTGGKDGQYWVRRWEAERQWDTEVSR